MTDTPHLLHTAAVYYGDDGRAITFLTVFGGFCAVQQCLEQTFVFSLSDKDDSISCCDNFSPCRRTVRRVAAAAAAHIKDAFEHEISQSTIVGCSRDV